MRLLTYDEIEKLAARKGVRRIAVENFLGTMGDNQWFARANLYDDARVYKWNAATVKAISAGIDKASGL